MPSYSLTSGDVVETRFNGTLAAQRVMFTLHHQIGSGGTPAASDLLDFQEALEAAVWTTTLSAALSNQLTGCFFQSQVIAPTRKITNDWPLTPPQGQLLGAPCPPTTAVVIRKRTALTGRQNRGRIFVPGIPFDQTTDGKVADDSIELWNDAAFPFADEVSFATSRVATPVVYSVKDSTVRGPIVNCSFDAILRVQRRREVGRGI